MSRTTKINVLNFLAFQICWLAVCFSAAAGQPLIGIAASCLWLILHVLLLSEHRTIDLILFCVAALLGFSLDSVLALLNAIVFPTHAQLGAPSTVWMAMLWGNLALTLRHSMAWLGSKVWLAALFGAVGGPLAYYAGTKIGALVLPLGITSALLIGLEWLIAMPILFWLSVKLSQTLYNSSTKA